MIERLNNKLINSHLSGATL